MKELNKSLFIIKVDYGIVSFNNDEHKPTPNFFEPSNIVIFPEPSMKPNHPENSHYNINFRYFTIKSIEAKDCNSNGSLQIDFKKNIKNYIKDHFNRFLDKFEHRYKSEVFEIESDIPYLEAHLLLNNDNDVFRKELIKKIYDSSIDDISSQPAKDVSIGRLLRLYNTPNRENAVYNTERCGFSVVIKMTDESYLNKVLNIFNKVDYGFIRSQVMKEEYTEIEVFIYSKDKLQRELDIQRVKQFIKGYLKCYQDSFEIKRFELDHNNGALYHKFNLTGHDNEVFNLNGDNVGIIYFRFTDEHKYNLAENVYEETTEFERVPEYGDTLNPGNRIIITMDAKIKNGIRSNDTYIEIYDVKLSEEASYIPEKYSFIKDLFTNDPNLLNYREVTLLNGNHTKEFTISEDKFLSKPSIEREQFSWFSIALSNLYSRLCYIDRIYRSQLLYGPYLDNMKNFIKYEFKNPMRFNNEEAPELVKIFFNVRLTPLITENIIISTELQKEFEDTVTIIMSNKFYPSLPNLRVYEGKTACDCGGK